ncbi:MULTISPECIES: YjcQ family protein [unclassified Herbaspirillum]|uniref:YjcQ family protein n=1 Tax=unclassified Herbaspirillum TaxID=2624150 RepID=UPI001152AFBF|nr:MULTISPECIES: YjcQ family protein [unclassified Herbaspirillum]MBB5392221.1 hypothetical protein [Herbaspirillum sp. SJZ102]TQK13678.1 YjcQ protein [Herbaspirillum sp. SJZ130]TQK15681.1 YjcQ protein [Herbaspirillum sp. SJZ106]TWC71580.1 YjcQ protein [Herbaspirillum sp. SJZ099]
MKRDWDLIRQQLTDIEEDRDVFVDIPKSPRWLDGETEAQYQEKIREYFATSNRICGHVELLAEAGYIEGIKIIRDSTGECHWAITTPRLTMTGHDLLDTMRSNSVWTAVKDIAKKKGIDLTFEVIKQLTGLALKQVVGS